MHDVKYIWKKILCAIQKEAKSFQFYFNDCSKSQCGVVILILSI